jgi:hypothetical protein
MKLQLFGKAVQGPWGDTSVTKSRTCKFSDCQDPVNPLTQGRNLARTFMAPGNFQPHRAISIARSAGRGRRWARRVKSTVGDVTLAYTSDVLTVEISLDNLLAGRRDPSPSATSYSKRCLGVGPTEAIGQIYDRPFYDKLPAYCFMRLPSAYKEKSTVFVNHAQIEHGCGTDIRHIGV